MDPILFRWRDLAIGWHGLWLAAAVFLAYQVVLHEGRRKGIAPSHLSNLFVWATLAGLVGARLLYVVDHWERYALRPASALAMHRGGLVLYGALAGGAIAAILYARRHDLAFWPLADAIALGIPVGEIVGRVGCTINGDIWGVPTDGSWGLVYRHPGAALPAHLLGVPTFPTPTLLQAWNLGLLVLLLVLRKRSRSVAEAAVDGWVFAVCVTVYSVGRGIAGLWQEGEPFLLGLTQMQALSLVFSGVGVALLVYLERRAFDKKPAGTLSS